MDKEYTYFEFTDELVEKLKEYINKNYSLDGTCKRMISDIIHHVAAQGLDLEETTDMILTLIGSIGITADEITAALT